MGGFGRFLVGFGRFLVGFEEGGNAKEKGGQKEEGVSYHTTNVLVQGVEAEGDGHWHEHLCVSMHAHPH